MRTVEYREDKLAPVAKLLTGLLTGAIDRAKNRNENHTGRATEVGFRRLRQRHEPRERLPFLIPPPEARRGRLEDDHGLAIQANCRCR